MYRAASYPKALEGEQSTLSSRGFALGAALMLVSVSYLLLLAVPAVSKHFRGLAAGYAGGALVESWLPVASVSGLALGGGAALLFVLMQIAREAASRPYVALAPVLAAFAGCILIGLRAQLPMAGVASEHVAVFALAVSVVGGALVQEAGFLLRATGLLFTVLPSLSLLLIVWTVSGKSDPWLALWSLPNATRAYLTMLAVSSSAIALLALLGRRCVAEQPTQRSDDWSLAAQADAVMAEAYAREQSYERDAAALARRGLPTWLVACLSAAAVVGGFVSLKLFLDARSQRAPIALVGTAQSRPVQLDPPAQEPAELAALGSQPTVTALTPTVSHDMVVPEPSSLPKLEAEQAPPTRAVLAPVEVLRATHADSSEHRAAHRPARRVSARGQEGALRARKVEPEQTDKRVELKTAKSAPAAGPSAKSEIAKGEKAVAAKSEKAVVAKSEPIVAKSPESAVGSTGVAKPTEKSLAARLLAKPADKAPAEKPAPTRGDESLDELMDNVVKSKRGGKAAVGAGDDPIFGL